MATEFVINVCRTNADFEALLLFHARRDRWRQWLCLGKLLVFLAVPVLYLATIDDPFEIRGYVNGYLQCVVLGVIGSLLDFKLIRPGSRAMFLRPCQVVVNEMGIRVMTDVSDESISWPAVIDFQTYKNRFFIVTGDYESLVVPLECLQDDATAEAFSGFVRSRISADGGPLLTSSSGDGTEKW